MHIRLVLCNVIHTILWENKGKHKESSIRKVFKQEAYYAQYQSSHKAVADRWPSQWHISGHFHDHWSSERKICGLGCDFSLSVSGVKSREWCFLLSSLFHLLFVFLWLLNKKHPYSCLSGDHTPPAQHGPPPLARGLAHRTLQARASWQSGGSLHMLRL